VILKKVLKCSSVIIDAPNKVIILIEFLKFIYSLQVIIHSLLTLIIVSLIHLLDVFAEIFSSFILLLLDFIKKDWRSQQLQKQIIVLELVLKFECGHLRYYGGNKFLKLLFIPKCV